MKKTGLVTIISIILFTIICNVKAQTQTENMQKFPVPELEGLKITVNTTAEAKPNENITININIEPLVEKVVIEYFNFSVFGFINGTYKTTMPLYSNLTSEYTLPYECNFTCHVPEQVWGMTLGNITLKYKITYPYPSGEITQQYSFTTSFPMTHVENVYLEAIEERFEDLNNILSQLNQTFREHFGKDLTPENFNSACRDLKGSQNELGSTRMAVGVLAITTVFFVATTAYLFLRKPKQAW
ncbi:MAG: hypothetical protein QW270_04935 [Candidatus Bathyarchaeia archaeon]